LVLLPAGVISPATGISLPLRPAKQQCIPSLLLVLSKILVLLLAGSCTPRSGHEHRLCGRRHRLSKTERKGWGWNHSANQGDGGMVGVGLAGN